MVITLTSIVINPISNNDKDIRAQYRTILITLTLIKIR